MKIGIVGGTGKEGKALAQRWSRAGHVIALGSRDAERARVAAEELAAKGFQEISGGDNAWACRESDLVVLCVPYSAHGDTLRGLGDVLSGRVLIDITVPLKPPAVRTVHLPPGQAAALEAQAIVGPSTPVVATLHHVSSTHLGEADHGLDGDVLLCTDDARARDLTMGLLRDLGLRPVDAGPLQNAIALEALTPVLLHINKQHKTNSGLKITGI
jgi:hypothetical protein